MSRNHDNKQRIYCPGVQGKVECDNCSDRRMTITGHRLDKWHTMTGESMQCFYVTPPCAISGRLIEKTVTIKPVGKSLNMMATVNVQMKEITIV